MADATDERIGPFLSGSLEGRRLVVRFSVADAVRLGADQITARGFAPHERDLDAILRAEGSSWTARAFRIGDRAKSWRTGFVADLIEIASLELVQARMIPGLRPVVAPTLVVVAARALSDGSTELFIVPIASLTGDPESTRGAASRVREAIEQAQRVAEAAGAFVSADPPIRGVADPDHPASRASAKRLLGWK